MVSPEGRSDVIDKGQDGGAFGGVADHGTWQEDGPVTWESLALPRADTGRRGACARISDAPRVRVHPGPGQKKRPNRGGPRSKGQP